MRPPATFQPRQVVADESDSDGEWQIDDGGFESEPDEVVVEDLFELKGCERKGLGSGSIQSRKRQEKNDKRKKAEAVDEKDVKLKAGSKIKIFGLQGAVEFNGVEGICENWVEASGRWEVRLPDGALKAFKLENLEALDLLVRAPIMAAMDSLPEGILQDESAVCDHED